MVRKVVEGLLIALVLIGGVLAWRTGQQRARLQAEYARLSRAVGDLTITDPTKIHVLALETGEPLHFAWRIYLPPNQPTCIREMPAHFERKRGSPSVSEDFIARIRFREDEKENGNVKMYYCFSNIGGVDLQFWNDEPLARILHGRWEKVLVEQLGEKGLATIDPKETAVLLRLSLPKDMEEEARQVSQRVLRGESSPVFYELMIGPSMPKPAPVRTGK